MCGFAGVFGNNAVRLEGIQKTVAGMLRHRGPDDDGFASGDLWALAFRRLSIIDLTPSGHQPMCTPDKKHWLVLNGEIYNYVELRRELEQQGERFAGTSDTEVLLQLLVREGVDALPKLNGMLAFAFVDTVSRTFLLARDRLGVKPLYFTLLQNELRFASELKALLAWPDARRDIDMQALAEFLAVNYLPSAQCIFAGYRKLGAAQYLLGSLDHPEESTPRTYWQLSVSDESGRSAITDAERDELAELLSDATRIRLRSDVPVGVFLSGGIDSGLVATLASKNANPLALTVAFDEKEYDEASLAKQTALNAGLTLQLIRQSPGSLRSIDELAWYYDEPFGDASALPTFMLCKAAAEHGKVFLSGDGGDEAFGGYRRYIEARRYRGMAAAVAPVRGLLTAGAALLPRQSALRYKLAKTSLPDFGYAAAFDGIPNDPILPSVAGDALYDFLNGGGESIWERWHESRDQHLLTRQQRLDFAHYLPDDILVKMDRASMAHSIEVRSPFLDYRIVEWAARLPRTVMLNGAEGKLPLRALAAQLLPAQVKQASKRGFGVPLDAWFRNDAGRRFAADRLLSAQALARGWWNAAGVRRMLEAHAAGRGRDFGGMIWRLLMLDAWARCYLDDSSFLKGACCE